MIASTDDENHIANEALGSIDVVAIGLPACLRKLRSDRHLTQAQLAERAGLTYRTVHDIESGRRFRVQEQTLLLLAKALEVPYGDLISGRWHEASPGKALPASSRSWRWPVLAFAAVAILTVAWLSRGLSVSRAQIQVDGGNVIVRNGLTGSELWRSEAAALIGACERAPWSNGVLLLGRRGNALDGGRLEARNLASGDILWSFEPDLRPALAEFGSAVMSNGAMGCIWTGPADLDGDGRAELLALFGHSLYYPHCLVRLSEHGEALGTYWCRGAIYHVLALDVDNDGKQEVYLSGTYNSPAYQGATVIALDEDHFDGIASDPPVSGSAVLGDGSLVRTIYPHFPVPLMTALETTRIEIRRLQTHLSEGQEVRFIAKAGESERDCILTLDPNLRVLDYGISDKMAVLCSRLGALPGATSDDHQAWIVPWLRTRVRIVEGRVDGDPDPAISLPIAH